MREEITTKDILILFLLSCLSFAESVTNLLTLLQYYDHGTKNWFYMSLTFLIFPCFLFTVAYIIFHGTRWRDITCIYSALCLFGCHPFAAAFLTLEAVFVCVWKKIWHDEAITEGTHEHNIVTFANICAFFAANCGSAPQFIIQLYVMSVQNKSMSNIQIISLVISFLFVLWTFHVMEEDDTHTAPTKTEIAIFIASLFLLSSRMFAITYFVVAFKWWTVVVLVAHFFVVKILHLVWRCGRDNSQSDEFTIIAFEWLWQFVLDWLGYKIFSRKFDDEMSGTGNTTKPPKILELLSTILMVFENITMILLYCFIFQRFDNWYSLLVTVSVCSFSVVGTILKSLHLKLSSHNQNAVEPQ